MTINSWGKIFAKFNFANCVRIPLQQVVGGARAYRLMCIRCKLFTAALAAAIAGDDSSQDWADLEVQC